MKIQEVILRAMAKKITWWQAAEIIGITDRQMRRWHWRYREHGYDGLLDRRVGQPSPKRVPLAVVEQVFTLYREKYFDLNVRHFHEKLQRSTSPAPCKAFSPSVAQASDAPFAASREKLPHIQIEILLSVTA